MPSALHEMLVELLRMEPASIIHLLRGHIELPEDDRVLWEPAEATLTPVAPPELRADLLLRAVNGDRTMLGLIVEAQLHVDRSKRTAWPLYVAAAHARLGCPVVLLVVTPHLNVARWARQPMEPGPQMQLRPLVLGPDSLPCVTLASVADNPRSITLLSGLIHKHGPQGAEALQAAAVALGGLDLEHATLYYDLLCADLSPEQRQPLEAQMDRSTYVWQSDFARRHRAEGRAEGREEGREEVRTAFVSTLLGILTARGLEPTTAERTQISTERDLARLQCWTVRGATAASVAEVLASDA